MKQKVWLMVFALCVVSSFALAQVDKATGTVTNDATMARLQFAHLVFPGPDVDLYVDGKVAVNAGRTLAKISADHIYGYMYLEPGSHSVAVVPTGKGVDEALIGPLDVTMAAGHRYTLAMMGQAKDESLKPLIIDETAELEKVGATQGSFLVINNVAGARTLDFDAYGGGPHNVPYGGFDIKVEGAGFAITVNGDPDAFMEGPFPDEPGPEPGTNWVNGFMGHYPGEMEVDIQVSGIGGYTDMDLITFLQNSERFETLLTAINTAGLTERLSSGGPYLLLAPTNEAFAALPKDQLDALMADPEALGELLRNHIIEAYVQERRLKFGSCPRRYIRRLNHRNAGQQGICRQCCWRRKAWKEVRFAQPRSPFTPTQTELYASGSP